MPAHKPLTSLPLPTAILRCLLAAVALATFAAAPAFGATKTSTSPVTGMSATLAGTQLTVTPASGTPEPSCAPCREVR